MEEMDNTSQGNKNKNLSLLHEQLVKDNYAVPKDYAAFETTFKDPKNSKALFDQLASDKYAIPAEYDAFIETFGLKKKDLYKTLGFGRDLVQEVFGEDSPQKKEELPVSKKPQSVEELPDKPDDILSGAILTPLSPKAKPTFENYLTALPQGFNKRMGEAIRNTGAILNMPQEAITKGVKKVSGEKSDINEQFLKQAFSQVPILGAFSQENMDNLASVIENAGNPKEAPDNLVGKTLESTGSILFDIATIRATPTSKINALAKYGMERVPMFPTYLATMGGATTAREGGDIKETGKAVAEGIASGLTYEGMGIAAGRVGQLVKELGGADILSSSSRALANSVMFGADSKLKGGTFAEGAAMGLVFGGYDIGAEAINKSIAHRSYISYLTTTDNAIKTVARMKINPEEMRKQSDKLWAEYEKETDPIKKQALLEEKTAIDNVINVNAATQEIIKNPKAFIDNIQKDPNLSSKEKKVWTEKINTTVKDADPRLIEAEPIVADIKKKEGELEYWKENKGADPMVKESKVEAITEQIKEGKQTLGKTLSKPLEDYVQKKEKKPETAPIEDQTPNIARIREIEKIVKDEGYEFEVDADLDPSMSSLNVLDSSKDRVDIDKLPKTIKELADEYSQLMHEDNVSTDVDNPINIAKENNLEYQGEQKNEKGEATFDTYKRKDNEANFSVPIGSDASVVKAEMEKKAKVKEPDIEEMQKIVDGKNKIVPEAIKEETVKAITKKFNKQSAIKEDKIFKEQKNQLLDDLISAEDLLLGKNKDKVRTEEDDYFADSKDDIIVSQYEHDLNNLPKEVETKLNKLGIKVKDGKLVVDIYKDGTVEVGDIRSALRIIDKGFPMRIKKVSTPSGPGKLGKSQYRTKAEEYKSLKESEARVKLAEENFTTAKKSGNKGLTKVMEEQLADVKAIHEEAKNVDYTRKEKMAKMDADKEFGAFWDEFKDHFSYDRGDITREQVYDIVDKQGRPKDLTYDTVQPLIIKDTLEKEGKTIEEKRTEIENNLKLAETTKRSKFGRVDGNGFKKPKNNREEWEMRSLDNQIEKNRSRLIDLQKYEPAINKLNEKSKTDNKSNPPVSKTEGDKLPRGTEGDIKPVKAEGKAEPGSEGKKVKEPWEMTRDEYVEDNMPKRSDNGQYLNPKTNKYENGDGIKADLSNEWNRAKELAYIDGNTTEKPNWAMSSKEFENKTGNSAEEHEIAVKRAIKRDFPVPKEVLREYPDIATKTWRDFVPPKIRQDIPDSFQKKTEQELRDLLANKKTHRDRGVTGSTDKKALTQEIWDIEKLLNAHEEAKKYNQELGLSENSGKVENRTERKTGNGVDATISSQETKKVTTKQSIPASELSNTELVQRLKAENPGKAGNELYGLFVKARDLKPDIDAKEFNKILASVSPNMHIKTTTSDFKPTDYDTTKEMYVQNTQEEGYVKHVWENGSTGSTPNQFMKDGRFVKEKPAAEPKVETPVKDKKAQLKEEKKAIEDWLESEGDEFISVDWDGEYVEISKSRDEPVEEYSKDELIEKGVVFPEESKTSVKEAASTLNDAVSKYGWSAVPNEKGYDLLNKNGKTIVTVVVNEGKGTYKFLDSSGTKLMDGRGQIEKSAEKLLKERYYAKEVKVETPVKIKELSVRDLSQKSVKELDGLIDQLESGMKDLLDNNETARAEKMNELIGKVIDARNEVKAIKKAPVKEEGIKFKDKSYQSVDEVFDAMDKGDITFEESKPLLEQVRKFEDGLKKEAENISNTTGEKMDVIAKDAEKRMLDELGKDKNNLNVRFLPPDLISKGNTALWKQLVKVRDRLANSIATTLHKGMQSQNDILRGFTKTFTNLYSGLSRTQAEVHGKGGLPGKLALQGTVKAYAPYKAKELLAKFREMVGSDYESMRRVWSALDPEMATEKLKYGDLSVTEKNLYFALKEWNTWVWSTNYANGFVPTESHLKFKGDFDATGFSDYIARMYDKNEIPAEIEQFAKRGKSGVRIKTITDYMKARKEVDDWKQEHAIQDPAYLTAKRVMQTIQNTAIKGYQDLIIQEHPEFVKTLKRGEEVPKGYTKLGGDYSWGQFRGKAVIDHVVEDFTGFYYANATVNMAYDALKMFDRNKINQFYKKYRTVYNPFVQTGNVTGNVFFASINGINPAQFVKNMITYRNLGETHPEIYKSLLKSGLIGDTAITGDMNPLVETEIIPMGAPEKKVGIIKKILGKGDDVATKAYVGADNIAKVSAYMVFRKQGLTHEQAVRRAYDSFQNYATVGKTWDVASKIPLIGPTFVKFQADLQRILVNNILTTPLTTIGTLMMIKMLGNLSSALSGETEEEQMIREGRKGVAKIPFVNIPLSFKVGKSEVNVARYLTPLYLYNRGDSEMDIEELSKFLPLQLQKREEGNLFPVPAFADATWGWLGSVMIDRDFRNMSISDPAKTRYSNPNTTTDEKIFNVINYALRSQIPFYKGAQDIYKGATGQLDYYGRKRTWYQAIMNNVIKIQEFDKPELKNYVERNLGYLTSKYASLATSMGVAQNTFFKTIKKAEDSELDADVLAKLYESEGKVRDKRVQKSLDEQIPIYQEIERLTEVYKGWYPQDEYIKENFKNIEAGKNRRFNVLDDIDLQKNHREEYLLLKKNNILKKPIIPKVYQGRYLTEKEKKDYANIYWSEYIRALDALDILNQEGLDKMKEIVRKENDSNAIEGYKESTWLESIAAQQAAMARNMANAQFRMNAK